NSRCFGVSFRRNSLSSFLVRGFRWISEFLGSVVILLRLVYGMEQGLNLMQYFTWFQGFGQEGVTTQILGFPPVLWKHMRCQNNDGNILCTLILTQSLRYLPTGFFR